MTVVINISEGEFARKCADNLLSEKFITESSILHTIDYYFEEAFNKIDGINEVKVVSHGMGVSNGERLELKDFSEKGGYYTHGYKIDIDCSKVIDVSSVLSYTFSNMTIYLNSLLHKELALH